MRGQVSVESGRSFRVASPPANALVTRELASELEHVLEKFSLEAGFDERHPVSVYFKPGIFGHHRVGRAADIYEVGGIGIGEWRARWDRARQRMCETPHSREREAIAAADVRRGDVLVGIDSRDKSDNPAAPAATAGKDSM